MPRFLMIVAMPLLIAGCDRQADPTAAPSNDSVMVPAAETAAATVPALEGEWLLTKVDGRSLDPGSTMVAAFGGGKVRVSSGCLRRAWSFTQNRNIVAFTADPGGSANCEGMPSAKQDAAFYAFDRATMAIFAREGREASLSGNGGNVTLERR